MTSELFNDDSVETDQRRILKAVFDATVHAVHPDQSLAEAFSGISERQVDCIGGREGGSRNGCRRRKAFATSRTTELPKWPITQLLCYCIWSGGLRPIRRASRPIRSTDLYPKTCRLSAGSVALPSARSRLGRIGTAIARRAAAFDMNVVYFDPNLPDGHEVGIGIRRIKTLPELLNQSDIVSLHVPLSDATRGMINDDTLSQFRKNSIFINIARGGLVDIEALERALRSGKLATAGLDVLPAEPPAKSIGLLEAWRNVEDWLKGRFVVTPHSAFYSEAGYEDMRTFSTQILLDYLLRGNLRNNVNADWRSALK